LPEYSEESEWQAVAKYLYGQEWRETTLQPMLEGEEGRTTDNSGSGNNGDGAGDGAEDVGDAGDGAEDVGGDGAGDGEDNVEGGEALENRGGGGGRGISFLTLPEYAEHIKQHPPSTTSPTTIEHLNTLVVGGRAIRQENLDGYTARFTEDFVKLIVERIPESERDSRAIAKSTKVQKKRLRKIF